MSTPRKYTHKLRILKLESDTVETIPSGQHLD